MSLANTTRQRFVFADIVLDIGQRRVARGGEQIGLSRLSFDFLRVLVESAPHLVTHEELAARVWGPRRVVTHDNVSQRSLILRQSLGDTATDPRYIESVRGYGYRLIPPVKVESVASIADASEHPPRARRRFALSHGFAIGVVVTLLLIGFSSGYRDVPTKAATIASGAAATRPALLPSETPKSIAVLPFEKLGPEPEDAYFAEALHAELVSALGRNSKLSVTASASVLHYAGTAVPLRQVIDELGVETILQGSVRYLGQRALVIVELVEAETGTQLWTESYDAGIDDVFAVRLDLARNISRALGAGLSPHEETQLEVLPTDSAEAFAFYMKAMDVFSEGTTGSRTTAQTFLDQAIALDGELSYAYAGKALVYAYTLINSRGSEEEPSLSSSDLDRLVRDYAATALELNPDADLAHYALGILDMFSWHWADAREAFERAVELTPQHAVFLSQLAWLEACALEEPGGIRYTERALALDPQNPYVYERAARVRDCLGDPDGALAATARALELEPTSFPNRLYRALLISRTGDTEQALDELRNLDPLLTEQRVLSIPAVALAYAGLGARDEAERLFDRFETFGSHRQTGPANWYLAYLAIGDYDKAYDMLAQAVADAGANPGFYTLVAFRRNSSSQPPFDEPRFVELRQRLRDIR